MLIVITKTAKSFTVCKSFTDLKNLVCSVWDSDSKHELNTGKNESKEGLWKRRVFLELTPDDENKMKHERHLKIKTKKSQLSPDMLSDTHISLKYRMTPRLMPCSQKRPFNDSRRLKKKTIFWNVDEDTFWWNFDNSSRTLFFVKLHKIPYLLCWLTQIEPRCAYPFSRSQRLPSQNFFSWSAKKNVLAFLKHKNLSAMNKHWYKQWKTSVRNWKVFKCTKKSYNESWIATMYLRWAY